MARLKLREWGRSAWPVLLIAALVVVLDQLIKNWVRQNLALGDILVLSDALDGYVVIHHVNNYGAAFGILQNQGQFFVVIAAVVTLAILIYLRHLPLNQRFVRVMLGLQMGGALGNVLDRLSQGYVTDYLRVGIPDVYYWPNFNVADSAIVVGVIGLAGAILWQDIRAQRAAKQENPPQDSSVQESTMTPLNSAPPEG